MRLIARARASRESSSDRTRFITRATAGLSVPILHGPRDDHSRARSNDDGILMKDTATRQEPPSSAIHMGFNELSIETKRLRNRADAKSTGDVRNTVIGTNT